MFLLLLLLLLLLLFFFFFFFFFNNSNHYYCQYYYHSSSSSPSSSYYYYMRVFRTRFNYCFVFCIEVTVAASLFGSLTLLSIFEQIFFVLWSSRPLFFLWPPVPSGFFSRPLGIVTRVLTTTSISDTLMFRWFSAL